MKENEKILSWINRRRDLNKLELEEIPICNIKNWILTDKTITHENNNYFSVIGVEVNSCNKKKIGINQ